MSTQRLLAGLLAATIAWAGPALADAPELRLSRTTTMAYLPLFVAEREKLIEKHAAEQGAPGLKVTFVNFTGPSAG